MSSRGPAVAGSDGSDFRHRQKIAAHYQYSVTYKFYLKVLFSLHGMVLFAMWIKIIGEYLVRDFGVKWPAYARLDIPSAYPWEYVWSMSVIPIVLGLMAMPKNRVKLMTYHYYFQFMTGILPIAVGLGSQFPEMIDYIRDPIRSQTPTFRGSFPMVFIWYIFFLIALQLHGFAMYFSYQLTAAWQPVVVSKKEN